MSPPDPLDQIIPWLSLIAVEILAALIVLAWGLVLRPLIFGRGDGVHLVVEPVRREVVHVRMAGDDDDEDDDPAGSPAGRNDSPTPPALAAAIRAAAATPSRN